MSKSQDVVVIGAGVIGLAMMLVAGYFVFAYRSFAGKVDPTGTGYG